MKTIDFGAGCYINDAAKQLIAACKTEEQTARGMFNEILLFADKNSTVEGIVAFYNAESERRAEAYRNSPEAKAAARASEERKVEAQQKHDRLMRQLPNLNFADDVAVLDWLCEFQDPSDYIGVVKQQDVVLATFAAHGYYPNVNLGKDFTGDDRDSFARFIIGQALDDLACEVGAINKVVHILTDNWKKKFLPTVA